MDTLGNRLKALRAADGRTQDEISGVLKKYDIKADRGTVARWENDIQQPTLRPVKALADIYGVSADYIIDGSVTGPEGDNLIKIPVYSRLISSGINSSSRYICGQEMLLAKTFDPSKRYFGFKMADNSMSPKYHKGDILILLFANEAPSGSDVLCSIAENDAVIRELKILEGTNYLIQPVDRDHTPYVFTSEERDSLPLKIFGIVTELRRRY